MSMRREGPSEKQRSAGAIRFGRRVHDTARMGMCTVHLGERWVCVTYRFAWRLMGFVARLLGATAGAIAVLPLVRWLSSVSSGDWILYVLLGIVVAGFWAGAALVPRLGEWMAQLSRHVRWRSIASGLVLLMLALALVTGVRQARSWLALVPYRDDTQVVTAFQRDYQARYAEAAARQEAATRELRDRMSRDFESGDLALEPPDGLDSDDSVARALAERRDEYWNRPAGEWVFPSGDPSREVTRFEPTTPPTVSWEVGHARGDRVVAALSAVWAPTPMRNNEPPLVDLDLFGVDPRVVELSAWQMYRVSLTEWHLYDRWAEGAWRLIDAEVSIQKVDVPLPAEFVRQLTGISRPTP